jgi:hypothetical protein
MAVLVTPTIPGYLWFGTCAGRAFFSPRWFNLRGEQS